MSSADERKRVVRTGAIAAGLFLLMVSCAGLLVLAPARIAEWMLHPGANEYATFGALMDDFEHVYLISFADLFTKPRSRLMGAAPFGRIAVATKGGTVTMYVEQSTGELLKIERSWKTTFPGGGEIRYELKDGTVSGRWDADITTAVPRALNRIDDNFVIVLAEQTQIR